MTYGLGRLIDPDPRDHNYPITTHATKPRPPRRHWWNEAWSGNQGSTPTCVAFAFTHWLNDGPDPYTLLKSRRPGVNTTELYCEAQKLDPWDGDCDDNLYDGTSVRAGAKVLKRWGLISEYRWAFTLDQAIDWLANEGTIVAGTWWYEGMSYPNADGVISVAGQRVGGHAYLLNGVDTGAELVRFKNSWGQSYGKDGNAFMSFSVLNHLLAWSGELCIPIPGEGAS